MPKYTVSFTANDGESAETVIKTIHTAAETNPTLDLESVKVEPAPDPQQPFQSDADYSKGGKQSG